MGWDPSGEIIKMGSPKEKYEGFTAVQGLTAEQGLHYYTRAYPLYKGSTSPVTMREVLLLHQVFTIYKGFAMHGMDLICCKNTALLESKYHKSRLALRVELLLKVFTGRPVESRCPMRYRL